MVVRDPSNQGHWLELVKRVALLRWAVARRVPIDFPFLNGTRLRCWTDTHVSRNLAFYRIPDYPPMLFMLAYLRPGDNVIDVGANVGLYTVVAGSLTKPGGRVDAVEAVPQTALRLLENLDLNDMTRRVAVHQCAVGIDAEWVEMTVAHEATNHMVTGMVAGVAETDIVRVKTGRLDDIARCQDYALGKIDIEGREWGAFRGATRLLSARTPPIWVVEINGSLFRYGHRVDDFVEWLADLGFDPWSYDPDSKTLARMREPVWGDVFFVARDRLDSLTERISGLRILS